MCKQAYACLCACMAYVCMCIHACPCLRLGQTFAHSTTCKSAHEYFFFLSNFQALLIQTWISCQPTAMTNKKWPWNHEYFKARTFPHPPPPANPQQNKHKKNKTKSLLPPSHLLTWQCSQQRQTRGVCLCGTSTCRRLDWSDPVAPASSPRTAPATTHKTTDWHVQTTGLYCHHIHTRPQIDMSRQLAYTVPHTQDHKLTCPDNWLILCQTHKTTDQHVQTTGLHCATTHKTTDRHVQTTGLHYATHTQDHRSTCPDNWLILPLHT